MAQEANNPSRLPGQEATLGQRLKAARLSAGWEQSQVAEHLEVHKVTVSKWERDIQTPGADYLDQLASFYGVSVRHLLRGEPVTDDASPAAPLAVREYYQTDPSAASSSAGTPRLARNLPLAVREYLLEVRARLTRSQVPEEMIDEAMDLLRSPSVFSYFKGGRLAEYNEIDVLDGMRTLVDDVVVPRLRKLGFKVP